MDQISATFSAKINLLVASSKEIDWQQASSF
jgi:hypothetical protein